MFSTAEATRVITYIGTIMFFTADASRSLLTLVIFSTDKATSVITHIG